MPSDSSDPLVSVVIPTYGRPDSLRDALESVAAQGYENIEVVVVDDCSPTPVGTLLDRLRDTFPYPLTVVRHNTNRGASAARNTGIERADGAFVAFLDDDDQWAARKIDRQVETLRASSDRVGVVYTGMEFVDGDGARLRTHTAAVEGSVTKTLLCRNFVGSFSTVMVRAEAIKDVGPLDERFPCWQDLEWYVRLSENWKFAAVPEPLARIRQESDTDRISDDFETIESEGSTLFVEKYRPLAAEYGWLLERKFLGWIDFRVGAYNALRTGHYGAARRHLLRAVLWFPLAWEFWLYLFVALGGAPLYRTARWIKRTLEST